MDAVSYRIDQHDRIVSINEAWRAFAAANGGLAPADAVVGRLLWDNIAGTTVRQVYRSLLARVRSGRVIRFPFRCDAPRVRREMQLTMTPRADGAVEFVSELMDECPRAEILLPRHVLIRSCAWCGRVWTPAGWTEVEEAVYAVDLFRWDEDSPTITHGICEACLRSVEAAV
ncbi:MAG: hypothetical protein U0Q55_02970 [Vicinamibacterales bacterium]